MYSIQMSLKKACHALNGMVDQPQLEAEILLAFALQTSRSYLHAWPEKKLEQNIHTTFMQYLKRRQNKEPLAYITGTKEFWSLPIRVNRDTLIPRPETELLIETVLENISSSSKIKIADIGTGSGAIALALASEFSQAEIYAGDNNENALQIAKENSKQLHFKNIHFYLGDWCKGLAHHDFDVIVSNPPYIAETEWEAYADGLSFEPKSALLSGPDGLDDIRMISNMAKGYLKKGGYLIIEHGFQQAEKVREIFALDGYVGIHSKCDLSGLERITIGQT